ncbi:MAG: hemolysin family protein [Bacteroidota bacterium]
MIEPYSIIIIVSALIFSAFFSGIEIAFLAADKLVVRLEGERKPLSGRILTFFLEHPDRFISAMLLGNTAALVVYSTYMTQVLDTILPIYLPAAINNSAFILSLQTLLSTLGILIVAEFIPKSIFLLIPNRLLSFFALPIALLTLVLSPLVGMTTAIAKFFFTYVLRQQYQKTRPAFGLTDLHAFIKNTLNINEKMPAGVSARLVSNLIEFRNLKVRDCLIPRTEIVAISISDGVEALYQAVVKSDYAKILVYRNDIDDIIGYCHSKELFKKPKHIESILVPIIIVSETNLASEVMVQLTQEGKSLALVVDEFGGTAGIVSLENIIEEIVGKTQQEHDKVVLVEQQLGPNVYLLSARHEIDHLNEKYGWDIPTGDYDTLGGLIISVTERIPDLEETVEVGTFTFTIVSIEDTRISTIKMTIDKPVEE